MEKTDELSGAKKMAMLPSSSAQAQAQAQAASTTTKNPKPDLSNKLTSKTKTREEGELSSSEEDDDELPAKCIAQSTGTAATQAEPVSTGPVNRTSQVVKAGRSFPASSVDFHSRPTVQSTHRHNFEKTRVPFKSGSPGWYPPSGTDNNLVIRFSDGDSGSDSDDDILEKPVEGKGNGNSVNGKRNPLALSLAKSELLRRTTSSETKPMPKKVSLSRTFVSSMTKINGANYRGAGPSLIEQGSRVRKFNAPNKNVTLDKSKLEGLREQIAIRENELKRKSAQIRAIVPGSIRNSNAMSLNNDAVRKGRAASAEILQTEPKEPNKKRLKVSKPYSVRLNSDNLPEIPAAKSKLASKESASEKKDLLRKSEVDCGRYDKEIPTAKMQPSIVRWQKRDDKRVDVPIGSGINASCSQPDRSTIQEDPYVLLNHQTAPLVNMASNRLLEKPKSAASKHNSIRNIEYCEAVSDDKSLEVSDGKLETPEASPNNANLWNCLGNVNVSGPSDINLQSGFEIEDQQDKELEEAQEYRRMCEIEERSARKAYRKAQRALIEANVRCNHLYRQRELFSAQFQSDLMNDSNMLWSSRQHEHDGNRLNASNHISNGNLDLIPKSIHQQIDYDVFNQAGYDSNIRCVSSAPLNTSYRHVDRQTGDSDPCSEPDGSTSELLPHKSNSAANGGFSPSNDPNMSANDDEETFSFDHGFIRSNSQYQSKGQSFEAREIDMNDSDRRFPHDSTEDSLLLEASLRSKLFARLGMRSSLKNNGSNDDSVEPVVERGAENDPESERSHMSMGRLPYSEAEKSQHSNFGGTGRSEETASEVPVQIANQLASHATAEFEAEEHREGEQSTSVSPAAIVRSVFAHMNAIQFHPRDQENQTSDATNQVCIGVSSDTIQPNSFITKSVQETISDLLAKEINSYTCNLEIDPFWPLCMFELRGKCNDEECSWQHAKDYRSRISNQLRVSDGAARQVGSLLRQAKFNGAARLPLSLGQSWQKRFSISLAFSRYLRRESDTDELFQHDRDGRADVHKSRNWQSLYLQSGNDRVNQSIQDLADNVQSLERALLILNQEANDSEVMNKSLSVLSRALEAAPTDVILWIVYLLLFYSNNKSIGKDDDMFLYAVKHNEGSYELWLLYINSRMVLDDRLVAYDTALSSLCRQASAADRDVMHTSACILDLFLQMMDCLCMSGNVGKAIQRIYELLPLTANSNEPHSMLLSDIFACLTISDKCIFWVCCVYLVIYWKLPDAVVQQFECEKELFLVEWPSVQLEIDQKQQAVKLMEKVADSIELYINTESPQSEIALRSVHLFALNHISCIVALDGLEGSKNLLDKYIKLYPSCLELVLISARVQNHGFQDLSFVGYEEALSKWPKEIPGIQCIWNQYAEYTLENGREDVLKEIMLRWFDSVWKVQNAEKEVLNAVDGDNSNCSLKPASSVSNQNAFSSKSNQSDVMFGFLNLALSKVLQNNHIEARLAFDSALKAAGPKDYKHSVREYVSFLLMGSSQIKGGASLSEVLNVLRNFWADARNLAFSESLSRRFIQNIKKPRVQQLISDFLSPISSDFSLVNLVLEVWHGPSLLPCKFSKLKDLVDFIEGIMQIAPSNYPLAFSVCKFLIRDFNSKDVTSASVLFWASSLLVSAIFEAVPVLPEYVYVEASGILGNITGIHEISEMFHKRALSLYPFSIKLWKSYLNLSKATDDSNAIVEAARENGVKLDQCYIHTYRRMSSGPDQRFL